MSPTIESLGLNRLSIAERLNLVQAILNNIAQDAENDSLTELQKKEIAMSLPIVQQFTSDGKFLRGISAKQGDEPGQFFAPHGVAIDGQGHLYVVDAYNHRVQKFATGK